MMESNRDESLKCFLLADKYWNERLVDRAKRFAEKSNRLFPNDKATALLDIIKSHGSSSSSSSQQQQQNHKSSSSENIFRQRSNASTTGQQTKTSTQDEDESNTGGDYTEEQLKAVKRIRACKDYYDILGVEKTANDADLKKSYRKLALQFHPDKNQAPGAGEAFKAIGNAFAILSDTEKRRQYDLYGPENSSPSSSRHRGHHHEFNAAHGFEADMTADEIFNMFFGGGFPSQTVYMRNGRRYQQTRQQERHHARQSHQREEMRERTQGYAAFMQLMPILLILFLSLFSSFFVSDPLYSLQQTNRYSVRRTTSNLKIPYFVKGSFHADFQGSLRRLEASIEEDYLNQLRQACFKEKSYKENLLWQARYSGNSNLLNRAHNYATPSCDQLEKLYSY